MIDMRVALDRLKIAICQLGGIDMQTGKSHTYADITAAEAVVMALYEEQKAIADKLAEALKALRHAQYGLASLGERAIADAALADYNKALEGNR